MTGTGWLLFALAAAAALALTLGLYRRWETPGRGRNTLALLRWGGAAILLLLLFDPDLPAGALGAAAGTQVLLDGSLSMSMPHAGGTRFAAASAEAARLSNGRPVLVFGSDVRVVSADSLAGVAPDAPFSRLLPALQSAAEAGVRRVVVLTDGGIDDAADVARWLPRLALDVDFRTIGDAVPDHALAELEAPAWAEAGKPLEIRFGVAARGDAGKPIEVVASRDGAVIARATVTSPGDGRVASGTLAFVALGPQGGGLERYDVAVQGADAAPGDDERSVYVHVSDKPAGVVLVSFRPDWELRFLQPVLERALGLPVRGYLRAQGTEYVRTGSASEAGGRVQEAEVRDAVRSATLVVLHALGTGAPAWATAALTQSRRLLVLPAGGGADLLPVRVGRAVQEEWYASDDVPSSPIAPLLAGIDTHETPPLTALYMSDAPPGSWAPLMATRGRRGAPAPIALGGETAGRRWAVALGEGYWRWAFRDGSSRQLYSRFWSALAGWLTQEQTSIAQAPVRPVDRMVDRAAPLRWTAPGLGADSMAVRLTAADGSVAADTVIATTARDTASSRGLTPGHYGYVVQAFAGDSVVAEGSGELTVDSYTAEFTRPAVTPEALQAAAVSVGPDRTERAGRPLHTVPWPYVLIILLLAAEWVLRRRWGLR